MYSLPIAIVSFLAASVAGRSLVNGTAALNSTVERRSVAVNTTISGVANATTIHIEISRSVNSTVLANSTIQARSFNLTSGLNATKLPRSLNATTIVARALNLTSGLNATKLHRSLNATAVVARSLNLTSELNATAHVYVARALNSTTPMEKRSFNLTAGSNMTVPRSTRFAKFNATRFAEFNATRFAHQFNSTVRFSNFTARAVNITAGMNLTARSDRPLNSTYLVERRSVNTTQVANMTASL